MATALTRGPTSLYSDPRRTGLHHLFPFVLPRPILSSVFSSTISPLPLEAALQLPLMPPMPSMCHLDAFDSQHAAAGLDLMMPSSASSPAAMSADPVAALQGLAIPGLGLEVHSSEATVRSLGGCFLGPLVLVATSDRTREHLVLRIYFGLFFS